MLSIYDLQDLIGQAFFSGDMAIAGMVMYAVLLIAVFALTRNITQSLILSLPCTLIFAALGVLSTDLTVLLIIVTVLALAYTARNAWGS